MKKLRDPHNRADKEKIILYIKYCSQQSTYVIFTTSVILNETDLHLSVFSRKYPRKEKNLVTDPKNPAVFLLGRPGENYGINYHDRELEKHDITQGLIVYDQTYFAKNLPQTIMPKLRVVCQTGQNKIYSLMHRIIIRNKDLEVAPS
jgi:hypothetical protein